MVVKEEKMFIFLGRQSMTPCCVAVTYVIRSIQSHPIVFQVRDHRRSMSFDVVVVVRAREDKRGRW